MNPDRENVVGQKVCQTVIITYLAVPPNKPPIEKIYSLTGIINKNLEFRAEKNKIFVQGKIDLETMYQQIDELEEIIMQELRFVIDFDYLLTIEGVEKGMSSQACVEIEYLNYSLVDSRSIELETIFRITAQAWR